MVQHSSYLYLLMCTVRRVLLLVIIPFALSKDCQPPELKKPFPIPKVPHASLNESYLSPYGEIFVIGDVHGCFEEMQNLLAKANATSDSVLKIFTGDIVRKGPKSLKSLHYVRQCPSCLTVRGNNDEVTLWMIDEMDRTKKKLLPWDKWIAKATPEDIEFLEELPYTISIPSLNAIVVHAGLLPGGVPLEDNNPWTMTKMRGVIPKEECEGGYEPTRDKTAQPWATAWTGPQHVFYGHDHKRQLSQHPFATGLDGSCDRGNYMAGTFIYGPRKGSFVTQDCPDIYYPGHV